MGHVDACGTSRVPRRTRHSAAVVALAGADECGAGLDGAVVQERVDSEPCAQKLECIQAEAAALVLGKETADT